MPAAWLKVVPAAGAALAYGIAQGLDGSGFIAAFIAGATFGGLVGRDPREVNALVEEVGAVLNGVTFLIFGAVLLGPALGQLSWELVLYAVLSLTVVRMLPVAISMIGTGARVPTVAFMGWFGPRGLASIVFAVIVLEESRLPHEQTILLAVYLTVGLSVLLHGLTATPLADRYGRWYRAHPRGARPDGCARWSGDAARRSNGRRLGGLRDPFSRLPRRGVGRDSDWGASSVRAVAGPAATLAATRCKRGKNR